MASKTKLVFIDKGFQDILSTDGTKSCVESITSQIAGRAGNGYEADVSYYGVGHRWIGFAHTTDLASMKNESENKSLVKAVR